MRLDKYDRLIVQELICNPRLSDNKLSQATKIPVKTVNRKRKKLEKNGVLRYMVAVDHTTKGTGDFNAATMYMIKFKHGIYRQQFLDMYTSVAPFAKYAKHISFKWIGEQAGHLVLILLIESRLQSDILEIYNAEIVTALTKHLGNDAIIETSTVPISSELSMLHNYEPLLNMKNGFIYDWPKTHIFVTDRNL